MSFLLRSCLAAALAIAGAGNGHAQTTPAPTPRMLVEVADLSGLAISPDGSSVAFREERASIERNTYDSTWYVTDIKGEHPSLRIADGGVPPRVGGVPINEMPQWSPDSAWLYFRATFDGETQVWRASRDGARAERVTSDPADVEAFSIDPQGRTLTYQVGPTREDIERAEEDEYDRGILIDSSIRSLQGLFRSTLVNGRLISPRVGSGWATTSPLGDAYRQYHSVDLATLDARPASDAEIAAFSETDEVQTDSPSHVIARFPSPSGSQVAILAGTRDVREVEVRGLAGSSSVVRCVPCRKLMVEGLAWRNDGELIITARNVAGGYAQSLYSWRIPDDSIRLIVAADGLLNGYRFPPSNASCAVGAQFGVCVSASANVPPRLERLDLDSGERTVLFDPNAALAQASSTVDSELLTWTDPGGRQFTGHLFTPASRQPGKRVPLFVTYYACPGFLRGGYGDEWPLLTLASSGIAALCVNYYRPSRVNRDAAVDYEIGRVSVETIVDILDKRGLIDRDAVGMGGLSYGSEITVWTATHSDLLAAASVTSPSATPTWYWSMALLEGWADAAMKSWKLGSPTETPDRWRQISPAYFPERIKAPLLMQMAEEEYRAALDYYVPMVRAGAAVEMYAFPHAGHWKFLPRQKLASYERDLDWFRFWLQGFEDSDTRKAEQYANWRDMRSRQCERAMGTSDTPWYCRSK
jgi:dipeptidyl aminopeptidase/acylaminoacyl peptidase